MIEISNLLKTLKKNKITFFCGVPDSILKSLSIYLNAQNKKKHVIILPIMHQNHLGFDNEENKPT